MVSSFSASKKPKLPKIGLSKASGVNPMSKIIIKERFLSAELEAVMIKIESKLGTSTEASKDALEGLEKLLSSKYKLQILN